MFSGKHVSNKVRVFNRNVQALTRYGSILQKLNEFTSLYINILIFPICALQHNSSAPPVSGGKITGRAQTNPQALTLPLKIYRKTVFWMLGSAGYNLIALRWDFQDFRRANCPRWYDQVTSSCKEFKT